MVEKKYFGEGRDIEFKRELPVKHEKFLKDVIAFSNCAGGKIILGIEDVTNIVYGIGDNNPFRLSDDISNMISDACTPLIMPDISIKTIEEKTILEIDIAPGKFRPYYLGNKGKTKSTYIRINGTSRPAAPGKLQELEMEGKKISYDSLLEIGEKYDEDKAKELCIKMKQVALDACKTEEEKLQIKNLTIEKLKDFELLCSVGRELFPTHGFMLLTDNKNKNAKIQCALFKGIVRDKFIDRKEFAGPIYEQVEEAYQFVLRHINLGASINGIYRSDEYELPVSAIREMIANAVLHRSYIDDSCIQVCVFDDRIEVLSPGMLYGGLDFETAKTGKSKCRNAAIAEAFKYMKIVEAWGTGLPKIVQKCNEYNLPEPTFEEAGDGIRVTMYRNSNTEEESKSTIELKSERLEAKNERLQQVNQSFESENERLIEKKQLFDVVEVAKREKIITSIMAKNILEIIENFVPNEIIGRKELGVKLGYADSRAARTIEKMLELKILRTVKGAGKGKHILNL